MRYFCFRRIFAGVLALFPMMALLSVTSSAQSTGDLSRYTYLPAPVNDPNIIGKVLGPGYVTIGAGIPSVSFKSLDSTEVTKSLQASAGANLDFAKLFSASVNADGKWVNDIKMSNVSVLQPVDYEKLQFERGPVITFAIQATISGTVSSSSDLQVSAQLKCPGAGPQICSVVNSADAEIKAAASGAVVALATNEIVAVYAPDYTRNSHLRYYSTAGKWDGNRYAPACLNQYGCPYLISVSSLAASDYVGPLVKATRHVCVSVTAKDLALGNSGSVIYCPTLAQIASSGFQDYKCDECGDATIAIDRDALVFVDSGGHRFVRLSITVKPDSHFFYNPTNTDQIAPLKSVNANIVINERVYSVP